MTSSNIYNSIASRTGGDIYIGVVGPVRTGKSTFIKRFMDELVLKTVSHLNIPLVLFHTEAYNGIAHTCCHFPVQNPG